MAAIGNPLSTAFNSCRQATSGELRPSQSSNAGRRLAMPLTLKVAIFTVLIIAQQRLDGPAAPLYKAN
jgi:hypothetical protein